MRPQETATLPTLQRAEKVARGYASLCMTLDILVQVRVTLDTAGFSKVEIVQICFKANDSRVVLIAAAICIEERWYSNNDDLGNNQLAKALESLRPSAP
jgi:hypothetical protein